MHTGNSSVFNLQLHVLFLWRPTLLIGSMNKKYKNKYRSALKKIFQGKKNIYIYIKKYRIVEMVFFLFVIPLSTVLSTLYNKYSRHDMLEIQDVHFIDIFWTCRGKCFSIEYTSHWHPGIFIVKYKNNNKSSILFLLLFYYLKIIEFRIHF